MRNTAGTIDTVSIRFLSDNSHVRRAVATLHVDTSAAAVASHVGDTFDGYESARPRDVFYITAACVSAHYNNRAAYSVALRRVS